ncbi:hypothetical protein AB6A40_008745 [Gnathostoma spinigerum]|uniref:Choline kinase n=1 Tax=Gnathostoma spinigerum TaxID=75299 RepID=A0ABD6ERT4_9BILA
MYSNEEISESGILYSLWKYLTTFDGQGTLNQSKSHRCGPSFQWSLDWPQRTLFHLYTGLKTLMDEEERYTSSGGVIYETISHSPKCQVDFSKQHESTSKPVEATNVVHNLKEIFATFKLDANVFPAPVVHATRDLCARYLGGIWTSLDDEDLELKAITGGMSNLLFLVRFVASKHPIGNEPTVVLLRIHCNLDTTHLLNESVIFTLLSERSLGPKLYGVFPGGRLEQFIPSRCLKCGELSIPSLAKKIGALIARVHALDVPTIKQPMLVEIAKKWLSKIGETNPNMKHELKGRMVALEKNSKYPQYVNIDVLTAELNLMEKCLAKSKSPVVFCHNDLQEGNILLRGDCEIGEDGALHGEYTDQPLVIIDYEYANHNYRAFDFANHMIEHILDYSNPQPPFYFINKERYPSVEQQKELFIAYFEQLQYIENDGQLPAHLVEEISVGREKFVEILRLETQRFLATSNLFWSIWSFMQSGNSPIEFDYVSYGLDRLILFYQSKSDLIELLDE